MKHFLQIAALLVLFAFPTADANAACVAGTCFGIATGNWGTIGTWSATTGGVTCACTPAAGDNVVLDANSSGKSFHIDANYSLATFIVSGASTATVDYNSAFTVTITGNTFTLLNTMTWTVVSSSRIVSFNPTSGTLAVTMAGKTMGSVTINGTAGTTTQLQDDLNFLAGGTLTITQATFDANNHNITGGQIVSSNANTRAITLGSGTHTLNLVSGTVWDTTTTTGLTMTVNTSTILVSGNATGIRSFVTGGLNFNGTTLSLANTGSAPAVIAISGAGTVASLLMAAPLRVTFASSTTFTVTNAFTLAGTAFNNALNISTVDTGGSAATISVATGSPSIAWAAIQGMAFTGGATFTATNSFDLKGNAGITITGPSGGGGGGRIIGGWLLKRDFFPDNDNSPAFSDESAA